MFPNLSLFALFTDDHELSMAHAKALMQAVAMGQNALDETMLSDRSVGGGNTGSASPQRIIGDLVSGGVCERFPNLHFNLIGFSAGWLVSYPGSMDKAWKTGTGQDPDWWLGFWDDSRAPGDQPYMGLRRGSRRREGCHPGPHPGRHRGF